MEKLCAVISCLLLTVASVTAQEAPRQTSDRPLPQWLTGIIAVCGFLFLTFVGVLVKKAWCEESGSIFRSRRRSSSMESERRNPYDTNLDMVRSKEDKNAFDNLVIDHIDEKMTSM